MRRGTPTALTRSEYYAACKADHGNVRRFLAGCRCPRCDTLAARRFYRSLPRLRPEER